MDTKQLRSYMVLNNMTQEMLCKNIGISSAAMSNKMNGKVAFKVEEATKICDVLHIDDDAIRSQIFLRLNSQK